SPLHGSLPCAPLRCPCLPDLLFLLSRRPPTSTLFPYTTLFRSALDDQRIDDPSAVLDDHEAAHDHRARLRIDLDDRDVRRVGRRDRKSTRLNSSHGSISYAVFCLKKKKNKACAHTEQADRKCRS